MAAASRDPWDLAQWMSRRLERLGIPSRQQVDPLLGWASWHLNTAQLGWDVLKKAWPDGDQNLTGHPMHTVEIAAENLIFRGVVSAMDLCAAAIFRLTGKPLRADRERDVGWWFDTRRKPPPWHLVPMPLQQWLRVFDGNATWEMGTELRNAFTHRSLRRHIFVTVGRDHGSAEFETPSGRYDAEEAMSRLVLFGNRRYSSFERALARSYPLR